MEKGRSGDLIQPRLIYIYLASIYFGSEERGGKVTTNEEKEREAEMKGRVTQDARTDRAMGLGAATVTSMSVPITVCIRL